MPEMSCLTDGKNKPCGWFNHWVQGDYIEFMCAPPALVLQLHAFANRIVSWLVVLHGSVELTFESIYGLCHASSSAPIPLLVGALHSKCG